MATYSDRDRTEYNRANRGRTEDDDRDEREARRARAARKAAMRRKKMIIWYTKVGIFVVLLLGFFIASLVFLVKDINLGFELARIKENPEPSYGGVGLEAHPMIDTSFRIQLEEEAAAAEQAAKAVHVFESDENTASIGSDVVSEHAILVDLNTDKILAIRDGKSKIYPASMTKIMTVLVAAEHLESLDKLDDTFSVTPEINYFSYKNDCSAVGFADNETVTVRDLFYGTILPSGADAAVSLATYIAGDQDSFVELMNQKCVELGISETTHFTNCVGLYDDDNYSTCYDMAVILHAAIRNDWCKEVLSAHKYTTSPTPEHPEGIQISNWFLRRIEDKDCGGVVECAKTGFVVQSRNCSASFADDDQGNNFICVTTNSTNHWRCIYDHVAIYQKYFPGYQGGDDVPPPKDTDTADNSESEN